MSIARLIINGITFAVANTSITAATAGITVSNLK